MAKMEDFEQAESMTIGDREMLKIVLHPTRTRLITALAQKARTAKELAGILGIEATKLYYHIKLLQKAGIIMAAGERQVGNLTETSYICTAKFYAIDPGLSQDLGKGGGLEGTVSSFISVLRTSMLSSCRRIQERRQALEGKQGKGKGAEPGSKSFTLAIETLRLGEDEAGEFAARMKSLIEEFGTKTGKDGSSNYYEIAYAVYPSASGIAGASGSQDAVGTEEGEEKNEV